MFVTDNDTLHVRPKFSRFTRVILLGHMFRRREQIQRKPGRSEANPLVYRKSILEVTRYPVSILYKSIAGRYRAVRVADGPITARYRFIKNVSWVAFLYFGNIVYQKKIIVLARDCYTGVLQ